MVSAELVKISDGNDANLQKEETKQSEPMFSVDDFFSTVRYGAKSHVNFILENAPFLVNRKDSKGYTATHWAAKRGDVEILRLLFDHGADLDTAASFDTQMVPIHWAASEGKMHALKFFLENRQDINVQDTNGCSPLVVATQYGQVDSVIYLAKNGADLGVKDMNGDSALHWAAYKGYMELVGVLSHLMPLELDVSDNFGQTPLHLAAMRGNYEVAEYLINFCKADWSKRDKNGLTPLELSMKKNQFKTEWIIRKCTSSNFISLLWSLGLKKLGDKRIWMYIIVGSDEIESSRWIWRVSFISNFIASFISIQYAINPLLADLYVMHVINGVMQIFWWMLFLLILFKSPGYVIDESPDGRSFRASKSLNAQAADALYPTKIADETGGSGGTKIYHPFSYDAALEIIGSDALLEADSKNSGSLKGRPSVKYPSVCHTCRVQRPLRSKHCRAARTCVHKFDHFCPYVFNTIGRDNYKFFVGILLWHLITYVGFLITTICLWSRTAFSGWFITFLIYSFLMFLMVFALANYHVSILLRNVTTNEDINKSKYSYLKDEFSMFSNPFDRGGPWPNAVDGCFPNGKQYYTRDQVMEDRQLEEQLRRQQQGRKAGNRIESEGYFEEAKTKLLDV